MLAGSTVRIPLRREWEYALVGAFGTADIAADIGTDASGPGDAAPPAAPLGPHELLYLGVGRDHIDVTAVGPRRSSSSAANRSSPTW